MEIEIIKSIWERNNLDSKIIFKNNTNNILQFITIEARFYDKDNNIIDVDRAIIGDEVSPHSEIIEILHFQNLDIGNIESYSLKVSNYMIKN